MPPFYRVLLSNSEAKSMKKIEKKELFKSGNLTVSSYDFEIPNGERA